MSPIRGGFLGIASLVALGCGVPNVVFSNDETESGSSGNGSSEAAAGCLTAAPYSGVCCQSLPSPIPCVGAACSPSLCSPGQCDQCVGQVCCAKATGMTVSTACRTDKTKCPQ
jgi:hypothetical protein